MKVTNGTNNNIALLCKSYLFLIIKIHQGVDFIGPGCMGGWFP